MLLLRLCFVLRLSVVFGPSLSLAVEPLPVCQRRYCVVRRYWGGK